MASERESAQTVVLLYNGVVGPGVGVTNLFVSRSMLERYTVEGDSPVCESEQTPAGVPEYHGAR